MSQQRAADPEKYRERERQRRAADPERYRAYARRWNNSEKGKAAVKAYNERQRLLSGGLTRPRCLTDDERAQRVRDSLRRYRVKRRAALAPERERRRLEKEQHRAEKEQQRVAISEQRRLEREQRALTRDDRRREADRLKQRKYRARHPEKAQEYLARAKTKNLPRFRGLQVIRQKRYRARTHAAVLFLRSVGVEIPKANDAGAAAALAYVRQAGLLGTRP